MKKIIYTIFVLLLQIAVFGQKQTITSVNNGLWLMPTTWDCTCVPTPGSDIVINHDVTLNTDFAYTSGSITVNSGASLSPDASMRSIGMTGGSITNNGTFEIDRLGATAGTITNTNTMILNQSFLNGGTFTNTGIVDQLDSLQNNGTINNNSDGTIESIYLWNDGTLKNDGHLDLMFFLNTLSYSGTGVIYSSHFYNVGTAVTEDSVIIDVDFLNSGTLHNTANNPFLVANDFMNEDSTYHDAVFINDGFVHIGNNFTNGDSLKGTEGSFCIAVYSANLGVIDGSVDICDLTPMAGPPYIDVNMGTIGANVTSCTHSCNVGIDENSNTSTLVDVFPNPYSSATTFTINTASPENSTLTIYDLTGNAIIHKSFGNEGKIIVNKELPAGIYFYRISNSRGEVYSGKLVSQ